MLLTGDNVFKPAPMGKCCAAPGETKPVPGAVNYYLPIAAAGASPFPSSYISDTAPTWVYMHWSPCVLMYILV